MKLSWQPVTIDLRTTFRIAHGASDQRFNVVAKLDHEGLTGYGEAAVVPYYGDTQPGIIDYLEKLAGPAGYFDNIHDPFLMEDILGNLPPGPQAGHTALDVALHDLVGQALGQPLYRLLGLNPSAIPDTSYSIGIDEPEAMAERARQSGWPIIKIKLGSQDDEAIVAAIRKATSARLRVDANAGWSRDRAAALIPRLVQYDLEMIEQPLPVGDIEGLRWLRAQNYGIPIFLDESARLPADVAAHAGVVDGIVIKLMKTGGIRNALKAIHTARALDLQVMMGCMVESSLGITAAAHLGPLCDLVDLDGPLLIKHDPYQGIKYDGAKIILPDQPGLGVRQRNLAWEASTES